MTPSDEDLNSLLKAWTVPPSPSSLEDRLRSAYRDRTRAGLTRWFRNAPEVWTRWVSSQKPAAGMFAGITAGAILSLLVITQAFPQAFAQTLAALSGTIYAFTVDYEEIEYKADGSSAIRELFTLGRAQAADGGLVLSSEFPDDPLRTAQQRILDPLNLILYRISTPIRERQIARSLARIDALKARNPDFAKRMAERERTCGSSLTGPPWTTVGTETILNYATTGNQKVWMEEGKPVRLTEWQAPALQCVTLKSTTEKTFGDGRLRPALERRALKVTMNSTAPARNR